MKPSDILEGLDPQQKAAGQLGPTETVKNNNIGKLVGANENFINTDAQAVVSEEDLTEHNHLIGVYRKGESQFQLWNEGQYQYKLTSMVGGVPKQYKQWNDFDLEEVKASLIQSGFQSMRTFTDESTKMDKNNLPKQYWNRDTQSIGPTPDAGLRYADPDEDGVHYPDYGNTKFGNTKFKGWRPSVKPQPQPTSVCKRKTDQQYTNQLSNHYAQVYDKIRITFNRRKDIFTITGYNGAETDHIKYTIDPTTCKLRMMSRISVENESINQGVAEGMFTKDPAIDPTIGKQINDIINRLHNHAKRTKDEYLRAAVRGAVQELFDILRNTGGTYSPPGSPGVRDVAEASEDLRTSAKELARQKAEIEKHKKDQKSKEEEAAQHLNNYKSGNVRANYVKEQGVAEGAGDYMNRGAPMPTTPTTPEQVAQMFQGKTGEQIAKEQFLGRATGDKIAAYVAQGPEGCKIVADYLRKMNNPRRTDAVYLEQGVAEGESNREMRARIRSKGIVPGIDREKYTERPGLEGPFHTKTGKVVYYDKQEGKYYDPDTDFYISHDDYQAMNEQGVAEGGSENKYSNLSNRGVSRGINRAGDDFNRMMDLDQVESPHYKTQHQQDTKQRLKTKPMAGPKGVLPEQGVAEGDEAQSSQPVIPQDQIAKAWTQNKSKAQMFIKNVPVAIMPTSKLPPNSVDIVKQEAGKRDQTSYSPEKFAKGLAAMQAPKQGKGEVYIFDQSSMANYGPYSSQITPALSEYLQQLGIDSAIAKLYIKKVPTPFIPASVFGIEGKRIQTSWGDQAVDSGAFITQEANGHTYCCNPDSEGLPIGYIPAQQGVAEGECPMCVESGTTCKECSMQMESLSQILRNAGIKKV